MNGAGLLVRGLAAHGVEHVFGHPGHGNTNILDALLDEPGIRFHLVRHEQAAAHIADGYARVAGKVGVCTGSVGPGATNLLMGVATAMSTSSPVLALIGSPIRDWLGRGQLQETSRPDTSGIDQAFMQMYQPVTKRVWSCWSTDQIAPALRKAFTTAQVGRPGPVAIEIPWDVQAAAAAGSVEPPDSALVRARPRAGKSETAAAAKALAEAKFPLILVGNGARLSGAAAEVIALAELLGAPISSSFVAKGLIPENHPLSVGICGWLGHPVAHELIREHADVILAVGHRFSDQSTSWWTEGRPFVPQNRIIQVDVEPREIARTWPAETALVGDARAVLSDLLDRLSDLGGRPGAPESRRLVERAKSSYKLDLPDPDAEPMNPLRIADQVRRILPGPSLLSIDTGNHAHYFSFNFPILEGGEFLNPGGWTPMGWGPTAIIGAALARPGLPAVSITGDGGFLMVCQEIGTAVEMGLPIVWLVFNNGVLAAIREGQKADFAGRTIGTEFQVSTDFAMLARALGAEGLRVNRHSEFDGAFEHALRLGGPCVLDLAIDPDADHPPVAGSWFEPGRGEPAAQPRAGELRYTGSA